MTRRPTTARSRLEHIECNAACDYAPVVMVNWEFFDNQTPESAKQLVDDLRAGETGQADPRRRQRLTWREAERVLAGFHDGRADEGPSAAGPSLVGLEVARQRAPGRRLPTRRRRMTLTPVLSRTGTTTDRGPCDGYERNGGYAALRKALAMDPDAVIRWSRTPACAAAAARASRPA